MKSDRCFRCSSHHCSHRIVTPDLTFDELACARHAEDLAEYADTVLDGALRCNLQSSATLRRGEPYPMTFAATPADPEAVPA